MSIANTSDPCGHLSLSAYNWQDISCNFEGYGYHIPWNASVFCLYAAITAISAQLAVQLIGRTALRFKRRNTLYFWSLITVAVGILIYIMALLFRVFILPVKSPAFSVPYTFAQIFILTGFGLVLYSRLHLITNNHILLRFLLGMIVVIAFAGHTMSFVQLGVISADRLDISRRIMHAISWLDVIFTLQDLILSVAYIYLYWTHMKDSAAFATAHAKKRDAATFKFLIAANSVVLLLDVIQNILLCLKIYLARYMVFPLICAIKLEVEFYVLNRLVKKAEKASKSLQAGKFGAETSVATSKGTENEKQVGPLVSMQRLPSEASTLADGADAKDLSRGDIIESAPASKDDGLDYDSMQFMTEVV